MKTHIAVRVDVDGHFILVMIVCVYYVLQQWGRVVAHRVCLLVLVSVKAGKPGSRYKSCASKVKFRGSQSDSQN